MLVSISNRAAAAVPMLTLAVSLACVGTAHATGYGAPVVTTAQRGTLHSLRGAMFRPDDFAKNGHGHPVHPVPFLDGNGQQVDARVQGSASGPAAPAFGLGFPGLGNGFTGPSGAFTVNSAPPDTSGAMGATQYVQVVNSGLAVFSKAGTVLMGPVPTNTLFQGMTGPCHDDNDGDATVVYDKAASRWVVSQFAVTASPYFQCVAVSVTSDATGAWNTYSFPYGTSFPDYPKMGVWPDAYYTTFNIFNGNTFGGAKLCAYDRTKMLAGAATVTQQCYQLSTSYGGVLPADLDGATAPPAGAPNYLLNFGASSLNMWKFHVDWTNSANSTLSSPISIPVATFATACGGGTCVPQLGVTQKLDSLGDRLMYRLSYRNFTGTGAHESLLVSHSVKVGTTHKNPYTGVRWYEIRTPGTTPTVYQQSTYSPDTSTFRWMPSIAMDKVGNIAVGYSASSGSINPAIRYTGRLVTDALSTLQPESTMLNGTGSQTGSNLARWGDYSTMTVDPTDDCTFWYSTEYLRTNGAFNWSTQIASFKYPNCI
jgi:hypothetical protein